MTEKTSPATQEKKNIWQSNNKFFGAVKEWTRKQIVGLKRRPTKIPLFWLVICMVVYTVCVTPVSYASINANVKNGGLIAFWVTLFSILLCVTYMNAFPKREKVKIPLLVSSFVILAILVVLQVIYIINLNETLATGLYDKSIYYDYFVSAGVILIVHISMLVVAVLLCALLPVYTKLINKIDTSISVAESDLTSAAIEIEDIEN